MFNTLLYVPTVLAYIFVILLVVILGFIVTYVTHKIYTTLYDNLPVAQLSSKFSVSNQIFAVRECSPLLTLGTKAEGDVGRKSKTALRIIVTLEPCYLAYMMFQSNLFTNPLHNVSKPYQNSRSFNTTSSIGCSQASIIENEDKYLIKYFDSLSSIPTEIELKNLDHFQFQNNSIKCRRI